jgi:hypothetical protein
LDYEVVSHYASLPRRSSQPWVQRYKSPPELSALAEIWALVFVAVLNRKVAKADEKSPFVTVKPLATKWRWREQRAISAELTRVEGPAGAYSDHQQRSASQAFPVTES